MSYRELFTEILKKGRVTDVHVLLAVVESNGVMVTKDIHEVCTLHIGKSKDDLYEITSTLDDGKCIVKSMFDTN